MMNEGNTILSIGRECLLNSGRMARTGTKNRYAAGAGYPAAINGSGVDSAVGGGHLPQIARRLRSRMLLLHVLIEIFRRHGVDHSDRAIAAG